MAISFGDQTVRERINRPFIWTAKATDILAKVTRAKAKLIGTQSA